MASMGNCSSLPDGSHCPHANMIQDHLDADLSWDPGRCRRSIGISEGHVNLQDVFRIWQLFFSPWVTYGVSFTQPFLRCRFFLRTPKPIPTSSPPAKRPSKPAKPRATTAFAARARDQVCSSGDVTVRSRLSRSGCVVVK